VKTNEDEEVIMKPETYKAAIYRGIGSVDVAELPYPECGDDDIVVKNLMATVCGSDSGAYKYGGDANRIWKDHEFGHEMVSEVVEIGKNVTGLKLGDHVFPNMDKAKRDRNRVSTVGGFSEYVYIPQCEVGYSVLMIPNDIPLKAATLIEPFVIGTRGAKSLEPGPGKTATVFGAGAIGMSAAIMLKWYGCDKVMIVDISDKRLGLASQFGLITCNSEKEDVKAKAIETFGGTPGLAGDASACDLYLDAVGVQAILDSFQQLARPAARLAVVGVYHEPATINMLMLCYSSWLIGGCGRSTIETLVPEIIEMIQSGKYDISTMISHEYKIEDIEDALKMAANPEEALKVAISYV
jgi:threonine dehydrogenase-like Zn-dependent dehydrogenase